MAHANIRLELLNILKLAIQGDRPEAMKAAITQQWFVTRTENIYHKIAERLLSLLSLESSELVKNTLCNFDF